MNKNLYLLLSLIFGLVAGFCFKRTYSQNVFHAFVWHNPPIVLNCYGNVLPESVVVRAIDYWAMRGFPIESYDMVPTEKACEQDYIPGFIIIKRDRFLKEPDILGQTERRTKMIWMRSAVIKLRPGSYKLDLLLEHELGHALGMGHVEIEGHVMHPMYMQLGPGFWFP